MIGIVWCLLPSSLDPKMGRRLWNLGERIMPWILGCGVCWRNKTKAAVSIFSSFLFLLLHFFNLSKTFHPKLPIDSYSQPTHYKLPCQTAVAFTVVKRAITRCKSIQFKSSDDALWVSDHHGHGPFLFTHSSVSINTLGCVPRNQLLLMGWLRKRPNIAKPSSGMIRSYQQGTEDAARLQNTFDGCYGLLVLVLCAKQDLPLNTTLYYTSSPTVFCPYLFLHRLLPPLLLDNHF